MELKKIRSKLPRWLGGTSLTDIEQMQAMQLAFMVAIEVISTLIIRSNGLMKPEFFTTQMQYKANLIKKQLIDDNEKEGTVKYEGMLFMANQLEDIASNLEQAFKEVK